VLFSNDSVAQFISRQFEPAWESVRPVPLVRFDFGADRVLTRTLHGNIASYVCAADGEVLDVLPGLYAAAPYRAALERINNLATSVSGLAGPRRQERLREYHIGQAALLAVRPAHPGAAGPGRAGNASPPYRPKSMVEMPVQRVLGGGRPAAAQVAALNQVLLEDTRTSESSRRLQIHRHLAQSGRVRPEQLKSWLYREVLHADLNDPYLGLQEILADEGIFRDES